MTAVALAIDKKEKKLDNSKCLKQRKSKQKTNYAIERIIWTNNGIQSMCGVVKVGWALFTLGPVNKVRHLVWCNGTRDLTRFFINIWTIHAFTNSLIVF